ncbi:MAG: hypothetical protein K5622_02485 [Endomicrobiaceae bacterium]|nr:hypothetical protein [Endomicrobiaceae bacterium]
MKKFLSLCAVLCLVSVNVFANPLDKFNFVMDNVSSSTAKKYLENLATDMGSIMTGSNYGINATLGFANLDVSLKLNAVNVDNEIMRAEGTSQVYMPMLVAAFGLFSGIDVIAKYGYFYDSSLYGAGLRYKLYESATYFLPSVTVQGIYSILNIDSSGNKVDNNNIALAAVASFPIPYVTPYVGIGFDRTKSEAKSSTKEGLSAQADNMGYSLGVSVDILMISGSLGVTFYDGVPSYTFGLSAGF